MNKPQLTVSVSRIMNPLPSPIPRIFDTIGLESPLGSLEMSDINWLSPRVTFEVDNLLSLKSEDNKVIVK